MPTHNAPTSQICSTHTGHLCGDDDFRSELRSLDKVLAYDSLTHAVLVDVSRVYEVATGSNVLVQ